MRGRPVARGLLAAALVLAAPAAVPAQPVVGGFETGTERLAD